MWVVGRGGDGGDHVHVDEGKDVLGRCACRFGPSMALWIYLGAHGEFPAAGGLSGRSLGLRGRSPDALQQPPPP